LASVGRELRAGERERGQLEDEEWVGSRRGRRTVDARRHALLVEPREEVDAVALEELWVDVHALVVVVVVVVRPTAALAVPRPPRAARLGHRDEGGAFALAVLLGERARLLGGAVGGGRIGGRVRATLLGLGPAAGRLVPLRVGRLLGRRGTLLARHGRCWSAGWC